MKYRQSQFTMFTVEDDDELKIKIYSQIDSGVII